MTAPARSAPAHSSAACLLGFVKLLNRAAGFMFLSSTAGRYALPPSFCTMRGRSVSSLPDGGNNYSVSLGLRIPLFAGFSRIYDQREAVALADAAAARADALGR